MDDLIKYIRKHTIRGACNCGKCIDAPNNPKENQPDGHTADVQFFKVALNGKPDKDTLIKLIEKNNGVFDNELNPLDGNEHSYIEIGGWIGDQGAALLLMGLGKLLGIWKLLTPSSMLGDLIPDDLKMQMAGSGMVSIKAEKGDRKL